MLAAKLPMLLPELDAAQPSSPNPLTLLERCLATLPLVALQRVWLLVKWMPLVAFRDWQQMQLAFNGVFSTPPRALLCMDPAHKLTVPSTNRLFSAF